MKKYSVMIAVLAVAGLVQASVVTSYLKPTSTTLVSGALDASVDTAVFEWSANNATIQMTLQSTGGNVFGDDSVIGVDNFRIGSAQGIEVSFVVTADAGFQLNALSFDRVRFNSVDAGSAYVFTDDQSNVDSITTTSQYFGFPGGADVSDAFVNIAALTKDNQSSWSLLQETTAGSFAIADYKVTTDVSVIPEPATLGFISAAGIGLIGLRRIFMV